MSEIRKHYFLEKCVIIAGGRSKRGDRNHDQKQARSGGVYFTPPQLELFKSLKPQCERRLMPLFVRDIGSVLPTKKSAVCAGAEYNRKNKIVREGCKNFTKIIFY